MFTNYQAGSELSIETLNASFVETNNFSITFNS